MDAIQKFLDYLKVEKNYSSHTLMAYKNDLVGFEDYLQQNKPDTSIVKTTYSSCRAWFVELSQQGLENRSINRKISTLRSFYSFLLKIREIEKSPLSQHKPIKVKKNLRVPFSKEEMKRVFDSLPNNSFSASRDRLLIELLYATGMRRGELMNLRLENLDLEQMTVNVLGKRNKERRIPLLNRLVFPIEAYLNFREKHLSQLKKGSSYLFITDKGNPVYAKWVYKKVNQIFRTFSQKKVCSPHILRHSFATHLLTEGANIQEIKELLGHSSLASTEVYAKNDIQGLRKVYLSAHPRSK
ncbi:tyrosine-type recombinase/integrase [Mesonia sp. HuA40]|uniref:tyrosine-type recombinase/integrase n=1 Tax=Mesonia sp. HuA40 TaxID=2602761 RepID=UPI0011C97634|nr:tyrosine-type recombinase/integrase [Mesonia sp. HuA40]TXK75212.1 tyrosine-type recombinase/integrase [Mesonia sp. HuA40]